MLSYGSVLENQVVFADFRQLENGNIFCKIFGIFQCQVNETKLFLHKNQNNWPKS